ncbi:MAG: bifunctional folylpolyglutamate synthase/dihydrofolate synthase [Beijerinckiaceae bacterium]|nr:bifunctional folylpolyglutamate synthase/dihydrofolate synthase [Beijerinckiaceae bacterium]
MNDTTARSRSEAYLARFLALHPKLIDLKLDRTLALLGKLGDPHLALPPVIHVAGTNGKGSTIAFLRAMLEADGKAVHVYTSPHLVSFNERIRLAGTLVDEDRLLDAFERCEAANAGAPITVFEITTVAALLLFSEAPADYLMLEVGLGGRYDATNVIETPLASVITPVSIDHQEYLGDTIEQIAFEKAGIIKRGASVIVASQSDAARAVIEREAARMRAPILIGDQDFSLSEEQGRLVYQDGAGLLDLPLPRLAGRHQFTNAATAIATLRTALGTQFPAAAIEAGLQSAEWPGRMQRLAQGRLAALTPKGSELWLDGGHNASGGKALADAFGELEEKAPRPLILVVGMLGAKETLAFLQPFAGLAQELYAIDIPGQASARPAAELADIARQAGLKAATAGTLSETLRFIAARQWEKPPRILICGSLYLAGEVLKQDGPLTPNGR